MSFQQPGRAGRVVVLLALVVLTACAPPAVAVPTPSPAARGTTTSVAVATPAEAAPPTATRPADPTPTPTGISPTATATAATATATATAGVSSTAIAGGSGDEAPGCGTAHVAASDESSDLSAAGRSLAPNLESFNQYRMDLVLDPEQAVLTGTQTLDFTNRTGAPLSDLLFHLYPNLPDFQGRLDITCAAVDGVGVSPRLEDGNWKLWLPLPTPLAPDASTEVTLHFTSVTPHEVGESAYGAFNVEEGIWTLASFYPTLAIRVGDVWDPARPSGWSDYVNSDMALYHARIALPEGYQLLASGVVTSTCTADPCAAVAVAGPQRDFTLAVSEGWEQAERAVGETRVVSSFPPAWQEGGEQALELAADALEQYNQHFGLYPYVELDILPVAAGSFAGVEYPGLIMIADNFYDEPAGNMGMLDVVVHEVAHMWWYNVVGNDVLREPWLDEGLTSYTGEYLYTEWSGQGEQPLTEARRAQLQRLGLEATPIDLEVTAYPDARSYVAVIYGRAPLFFDALRNELGDAIFFEVLREHYRRNAFGRATTAGFEALVEEIAGRDLDPFLSQWLARKQS